MTKKIFRCIFSVSMAVLVAGFVSVTAVLYGYFSRNESDRMKTELLLTASAVEQGGVDYLNSLGNVGCRLTLISNSGEVLFDSEGDTSGMENHMDREEVREAFSGELGEAVRYSSTLTKQTIYYAKLLKTGDVLRISIDSATVTRLIFEGLEPLIFIFVFALVISLVLAKRLSKKIVEPFCNLDLDRPLENNAYDELSPLLTHIEHQHEKIRLQRDELKKRKNEFYTVIENMNEGLVLLSGDDTILSINPAAEKIFGCSDAVGKNFIDAERDLRILNLLEEAKNEKSAKKQLDISGREYQFNITRVESSDGSFGLVILMFDVTESVFAERRRREFTANVSHELKSPLQTIMGSAELIENGMVKADDVGTFAGKIRSESERLVRLIDDIIRLSRLDEGEALESTKIDLFEAAKVEAETVAPAAKKKNVTVTVQGEPVTVNGVYRLVHEIIYNLCDNAVKYNKDGGSVTVSVEPDPGGGAVLSVSDTGIGIPKEDINRVFERFYRVDKSRSRSVGGTGLGLSIVKHAAEYMGASVSLKSETGIGTEVKIVFPGEAEKQPE